MALDRSQEVRLPRGSSIESLYGQPDLADAYCIDLPSGATRDPATLARFIFAHPPRWVSTLMAVRDACVAGLGLKTGRSLRRAADDPTRVGIFRLYESRPAEVVFGEDDKHLDFRASVLVRETKEREAGFSVVMSTVVRCHNALGRTYLRLIAPFHRLIIRSLLRRASTIGWPRETPGR